MLKERTLKQEERVLRERLSKAAVDWNDPLSADDYKAWHDHAIHCNDVIKETEDNLLALITTSFDGVVSQESLTVRASDFHPVERSVQFDDHEVVDIAEVAYETVPWSSSVDNWFEAITPAAGVATDVPTPLLTFRVAAIHSLASISVGAQPGPIEKYYDDKGWDKDECRKISYDLLDSSTVILQESRKIGALLTESSPDRPLTLTAESILDELMVQHGNRMAAAIQQQERALAISGGTVAMSEHNVTAFNVGTLVAAAQHKEFEHTNGTH